MRPKARSLSILCLLMIPATLFCWRNRDVPNFGSFHDDGMLYISAKSLAQGSGYRIVSLPTSPNQTKHPPLYPLYMSLVWAIDSHFPGNLRLATFFNWLILVAMLGLTWTLYGQWGIPYRRKVLLTALVAVNPYVLVLGTSILSDIFFTCFVLITMILIRRESTAAILLAGFTAACGFYARSAGIALIASVPLFFLWRKDWRRALVFSAVAGPAVIAWALWTATHHRPTTDPTMLFYTDYVGYLLANVDRTNFASFVWNNLDQIVYSMGSLILPKVIEILPLKILTEVIGIAMLSGTIRLVRKNIGLDYFFLVAVNIVLLTLWVGPPTERLVVPLYPLLIAGFVTELEHLGNLVRSSLKHRDVSQRVAGALMGAMAGAVVAGALSLQLYMSFAPADEEHSVLSSRRADYEWISANLPRDANVFSYDDPLLYLYTGHHGNSLPLPIRWWYPQKDHIHMVNAFRDLGAYCRARGLQFVYLTKEDLSRETDDNDRKAVEQLVQADPSLTLIHKAQLGVIYQVSPEPEQRASQ